MFTITQSLLVCIFIKGFLHAVFTVLLGFALYLVLRNNRVQHVTSRRPWMGLTAIVVMYLIDTAHIGMIIYQDVRDFGGGKGQIRSAKAFGLFGLSQITMEYVVYVMADLLLLWRAWVIFHGNRYALAVPALLILGMMVSCFSWIGHNFAPVSHVTGNKLEDLFVQLRSFKIRQWHLASVTLSAITNTTLTAMIAGKLMYHHWKMRKEFGFTTLYFESLVIVESGAIYAVGWLIYIAAFATKHNAQAILLDSLSELAGIVPTLIIVTVALGLNPSSPESQDTTLTAAFKVSDRAQVSTMEINLEEISSDKPVQHGGLTTTFIPGEDTASTGKLV